MALCTLDLSFFRKWPSEWTEQKEEMLRKRPRVVLHQQAILANLCDTEATSEHAGDQLDDGASLDTSPGLLPFPYFSDQEDGEGSGGGDPCPTLNSRKMKRRRGPRMHVVGERARSTTLAWGQKKKETCTWTPCRLCDRLMPKESV